MKEDDGDRFLAEVGVLLERELNSGATVLPVVDQETGVHGDVEMTGSEAGAISAVTFEVHVAVYGGSECAEDVVARVVQDVLGQGGEAPLVEDALSP